MTAIGRPGIGSSARGSWLRAAVWALHLAIPLLTLWLLVQRPAIDVRWEHHDAHFGLVLATAAVNVVLAVLVSRAAARHGDDRLFLVSLAFVVSAGFLGLHALATPGVLLVGKNSGFVAATPVGLLLAAVFAALSTIEFSEAKAGRVLRLKTPLQAAVVVLLIGWGAWSLAGLPPLNQEVAAEEAEGPLLVVALIGSTLYAWAALRYWRIYRRRPAVMLISVITAFVLLAESMFAVAFGRNWHASWWEWHLLMAVAFAFVAYSAHVQYAREGSPAGLFRGVGLDRTLERVRHDHAAALEEMVAAMRRRAGETDQEGEPLSRVAARLAARFDLTERQLEVLERSADALGFERDQKRRLNAIAGLGREASVIRDEQELLARAMALAADGFAPDQISLTLTGDQRPPDQLRDEAVRSLDAVGSSDGRRYLVPLNVKGHPAGVLEAVRAHAAFGDADRSLLRSFASQLAIALENARLYHQLDGLFRSYMSPDVATALLADPSQAGLGGSIVEVTVLMADLHGFTPFAEQAGPEEVVTMLNAYFAAVVPVILDEGGTVVQFVGDEVMAVFNAPTRQPDHPLRAARAGLRLQQEADAVAARHERWPRFRVGINSGPALVGNVGSAQIRNFAAIGDTTNLAARLQGEAESGQVVVGPITRRLLGDAADVESLGKVSVKGKRDPVEVFLLRGMREIQESDHA